eukprot:TRINITY_DN285_c0_g1_i2.p1 TRINITY_DN285_c0_g1~~TRINITY_DN285_c0_g1_i2.p1  ORF type:complete len:1238 (-),score=479.98 TRINITY_DN285_c0_g1_i2:99-3812(-)
MGVPSLFKYLAEKYPKILSKVIEEYPQMLDNGLEVPIDFSQPNPNNIEFDNLYLDMNGIIHPCVHPEDRPAPETEEEMMEELMRQVDRLLAMVRPRKVLFMAIDGVAPRAKMNQQRSRRFKTIREANIREKKEQDMLDKIKDKYKNKGVDNLPFLKRKKKERFDYNCITPGTTFMDKVAKCLEFYIKERYYSQKAWRNLKVIISDSNVPGEGEHKIMEFIRIQREQQDYDPNTKHVICGLDADLIMLGLATHEPHFFVLREEVLTNNTNKFCSMCGKPGHAPNECSGFLRKEVMSDTSKENAEKVPYARKTYYFLNLFILREYLVEDLKPKFIDNENPFHKSLLNERLVDDWVFICFLVGNDFLPHSPTLEIREGAIDLLMFLYTLTINEIEGYLTENGSINWINTSKFLTKISEVEPDILCNRSFDEKRRETNLMNKRSGNNNNNNNNNRNNYNNNNYNRDNRDSNFNNNNNNNSNTYNNNENKSDLVNITNNNDNITIGSSNAPKQENISGSNNSNVTKFDDVDSGNIDLNEFLGESVLDEVLDKKLNKSNTVTEQDIDQLLVAARIDERNLHVQKKEDTVKFGEFGWHTRYYKSKFKLDLQDIDFSDLQNENVDLVYKVASSYLDGLEWVFKYYYTGCASWEWFYPYYYSPFTMDLVNLIKYKTYKSPQFNLGVPFTPLQQLMSVLPPASSWCLPKCYAALMTDPNSEILHYYPENFEVDMEGKAFEWQSIAKLPFIESDVLINALAPFDDQLNKDEKRRNALGEALVTGHCDGSLLPMPDFSNKKWSTKIETKKNGLTGEIRLCKKSTKISVKVASPIPDSSILMDEINNVSIIVEIIFERPIFFQPSFLLNAVLPPSSNVHIDYEARKNHGAAAKVVQYYYKNRARSNSRNNPFMPSNYDGRTSSVQRTSHHSERNHPFSDPSRSNNRYSNRNENYNRNNNNNNNNNNDNNNRANNNNRNNNRANNNNHNNFNNNNNDDLNNTNNETISEISFVREEGVDLRRGVFERGNAPRRETSYVSPNSFDSLRRINESMELRREAKERKREREREKEREREREREREKEREREREREREKERKRKEREKEIERKKKEIERLKKKNDKDFKKSNNSSRHSSSSRSPSPSYEKYKLDTSLDSDSFDSERERDKEKKRRRTENDLASLKKSKKKKSLDNDSDKNNKSKEKPSREPSRSNVREKVDEDDSTEKSKSKSKNDSKNITSDRSEWEKRRFLRRN